MAQEAEDEPGFELQLRIRAECQRILAPQAGCISHDKLSPGSAQHCLWLSDLAPAALNTGWGFSYGRHRLAKTFRSDVTTSDGWRRAMPGNNEVLLLAQYSPSGLRSG